MGLLGQQSSLSLRYRMVVYVAEGRLKKNEKGGSQTIVKMKSLTCWMVVVGYSAVCEFVFVRWNSKLA